MHAVVLLLILATAYLGIGCLMAAAMLANPPLKIDPRNRV